MYLEVVSGFMGHNKDKTLPHIGVKRQQFCQNAGTEFRKIRFFCRCKDISSDQDETIGCCSGILHGAYGKAYSFWHIVGEIIDDF